MAYPEESVSSMGYLAARMALDRSGTRADELVGIIVATITENINFPCAAAKIQRRLGVPAENCLAYDIALACAGFPEALMQVNSRVLRRPGNYLVVASETMTRETDPEDINSTLFGDGAGAAVLVPTEDHGKGIVGEYSTNDPYGDSGEGIYDVFRDNVGHLRMPNGRAVFKMAVNGMIEASRAVKERAGWDKFDVCIPHQANARILGAVGEKLTRNGIIVYSNIDRCGNMSAATIPVALHEACLEGVVQEGIRVALPSVGSGYSKAAVAMRL